MFDGINTIFWGSIFMFFKLNIGRLQLIPNFIVWLIIVFGFNKIIEESGNNEFKQGRNLALASFIYSLVLFILDFLNRGLLTPRMGMYLFIIGELLTLSVYLFIFEGFAEIIILKNLLLGNEIRTSYKRIILFDILLNLGIIVLLNTYFVDNITEIIILKLVLKVFLIFKIKKIRDYYRDLEDKNIIEEL